MEFNRDERKGSSRNAVTTTCRGRSDGLSAPSKTSVGPVCSARSLRTQKKISAALRRLLALLSICEMDASRLLRAMPIFPIAKSSLLRNDPQHVLVVAILHVGASHYRRVTRTRRHRTIGIVRGREIVARMPKNANVLRWSSVRNSKTNHGDSGALAFRTLSI